MDRKEPVNTIDTSMVKVERLGDYTYKVTLKGANDGQDVVFEADHAFMWPLYQSLEASFKIDGIKL